MFDPKALSLAKQQLFGILWVMVKQEGSDLYLSAGAPIAIRVQGQVKTVGDTPQKPGNIDLIARSIMTESQWQCYLQTYEINFGIGVPKLSRFRVCAYRQRGSTSLVLRYIPNKVPTIEELKLPKKVAESVLQHRGLIIFVGATGQGKSTTQAALVDYRNRHSHGHIVTFEDPIEFLHEHRQCIISQREIGIDTQDMHTALKNALRQAPDVVVVGEVRERQTMEHALELADTGHLCLMTLHATNASQALERMMNFFPHPMQGQILQDLSLNLNMILSQRLVPARGGKRQLALEILYNSPLMRELIQAGKVHEVKLLMGKSEAQGMQTFDQALFALVLKGQIEPEEALRHADSYHDLNTRLRLHFAGSQEDQLANVTLQADASAHSHGSHQLRR